MILHELIKTWFGWVEAWGYGGVFILMAMESSIIPVPSEIVMAPAAFWAAQGKMTLFGVILAGTLGSLAGSWVSYGVALWVGKPFLNRYGRYFLIPPAKLEKASLWVQNFGVPGVFFSRFLPVIRHLISIPAGLFRMSPARFTLATFFGAGLWCAILSWFGQQVIGGSPELLQSPETLAHVMKAKLGWLVAGVVVLAILYTGVAMFKPKNKIASQLTPRNSQ